MAASARSAGVPPNGQDDKNNPEVKKRQMLEQGPLLTMTYDNSHTYQMEENMFSLLKDLFEGMASSTSQKGVVRPIRFLETMRKNAYGFREPIHHDAHEFLIFLLNELTNELEANVKKQEKQAALTNGNGNATAPDGSSLIHSSLTNGKANGTLPVNVSRMIHDLFEGLISSETRCLTCETTSKREEVFLDLSVDLGEYNSVTSCLRQFSQEEMLYERNKFHCDNCGGLQEAEKRIRVKNLPQILVLQLKRFQFRYVPNIHYKKVFYRVVYPLYLRMFNTTDEAEDQDRLYELYAVVIHIGSSLQHGHYVSVVKTPELGWLLLDDELVEPVDSNFVQHFFGGEPRVDRRDQTMASAYVLFYRQTTFEQMQKDMDKESARPTAADAAAHHEAPKDTHGLNLYEKHPGADQENLQRTATSIPMPIPSYEAKYENLDHFPTAPETPLTPSSPSQTKTSFFPKASAAKKEEKERKAAEKAAEKERKKAEEQRRKEHFKQRAEQQKQQDAELKAALAASKLTKAEEDQKTTSSSKATAGAVPIPNKKASDVATSNGSPPVVTGSPQSRGFSRFRKGSKSMHISTVLPIASVSSSWSLRDKEKADAAKANTTSPAVPPVPASAGADNLPVLPTNSNNSDSTTTDQTQSQQGASSTNTVATTASEEGDTVPTTIASPRISKSHTHTFFGGHNGANGNGKSEEPTKKSKFGSLRKRTTSMSFLNPKDKSSK